MLDATYYAALGLSSIREKVLSGERLSPEDGLTLFNCPDITAVGALALPASAYPCAAPMRGQVQRTIRHARQWRLRP